MLRPMRWSNRGFGIAFRGLAVLAFVVAGAQNCGGGPFGPIPGGRLAGAVEAKPASDWSFVGERGTLDLETRPDDPYSVRVGFVQWRGRLYIDPGPARRWLAHLRQDSRVRVRIAGRIWPLNAVLVTDREQRRRFEPDRHVYRLEARP